MSRRPLMLASGLPWLWTIAACQIEDPPSSVPAITGTATQIDDESAASWDDVNSPASEGDAESPAEESEECISQCELSPFPCEERPIDDFADFATNLAEWQSRDSCWGSTVAGRCADGTVFLHDGWSEGAETRFFEAASGAFFAQTILTDSRYPPCSGRTYWPAKVTCDAPVVTQSICGSAYEPGDVFRDLE